MTKEELPAAECSACSDCPESMGETRREFLRQGFAAAFTALATLGFVGRAEAVPIRWTRALAGQGDVRSYNVPATDGAEIDHANEVILVRWQNAVYAFNLFMCAMSWRPLQSTLIRANGGERSELAKAIGDDLKGKMSLAMYGLAIPAAFWQPLVAGALIVAVALMWFVPDARIERRLAD